MRVPKYVEVSDDLRLSRQKESEAHREFLEEVDKNQRWNCPPNLRWSEFYESQEVAE